MGLEHPIIRNNEFLCSYRLQGASGVGVHHILPPPAHRLTGTSIKRNIEAKREFCETVGKTPLYQEMVSYRIA